MTIKAVISVYDKTGILELAQMLSNDGAEVISTGKTYVYLKENGINATLLSKYTGFPEVMDGRVKTLHPKIHGGILADRKKHKQQMQELDIAGIDLVVVNLYPFQDYVKNNYKEADIIENIDIGGVTLLRSAAKNFADVCVLSDPKDYKSYSIDCSLDFRKKMASKAFAKTASYDSTIANWFCKQQSLPDVLNLSVEKKLQFRYGENPHQAAAFYSDQNLPFTKLQGKDLSYNNVLDAQAATSLVNEFKKFACVIVKHNNPCGVAISKNSLEEAYKLALAADPLSAFGGVVAFNDKISSELAKELCKTFFEVIIAPEIQQDAQEELSRKKNLRVLRLFENKTETGASIKSAMGGLLLQQQDINCEEKFEVATHKSPTAHEKEQLIFANIVCKHVKSNAIVVAKNNRTFGIGAGQMSRIKSVQIALDSAAGVNNLVMASDAFFPFADSIELAAKHGVSAIIQPSGSIKDKDVIQKANECGIAMVFTGARHFRH